MKSLFIYGKVIREYKGVGIITMKSGQVSRCGFKAVQLCNGKIIVSCRLKDNQMSLMKCFNDEDKINFIKGTTRVNEQIIIEGNIFIISSNFSDIIVRANSIKLKSNMGREFKEVRFGITNFEYLGNKRRYLPSGGWSLDILSLNLGGNAIEINNIQDYKVITESVIAQRGIDVTSEALVNIFSMTDLDTVIHVIDVLCKLLSLARGTKINWIYYDCYDSLGQKILSYHRNSIVWRYAGLPLIDPRNPNETTTFLEHTYPFYISLKDKYGLENSIEAYLDAKREGVYLETRALVASVLLEYLSDKYVNKDGEFKKNLETTLKGLGISTSEDDLIRLRNIRNSLAHTASFIGNISEEHIQDYNFLMGMLDRIFLKILNYNGTFLDITDEYKRVNTT